MFRPKINHAVSILSGVFAVVTLTVWTIFGDDAVADIIKKEDLLRGIPMTPAQCSTIEQAAYLRIGNQGFCVRYYISTAGGEGARPVVFLNGDSNGPIAMTLDASRFIINRAWTDPTRARDENTDDLAGMADGLSKMAKTTAIYIARIGDQGTSGSHLFRKTLLELQLVNATLDALKQRYRFDGFNLGGESGGARIMFGLLGMRQDIGCAISGSGQLVNTETNRSRNGDPSDTYFDVLQSIAPRAQNPAERIIMLTDPADQQAPASTEQMPVLAKWRQAGHSIYQLNVLSTDPNHHGVFEYIELAMAGCVLRRPDADIARAAGTIIRRNTDIIQSRHDKAEAKARAGAIAH